MSPLSIAVLDASVLVPEWSRKLLQRLAAEEPPRFIGVWSSAIIAETWRILTIQRINAGSSASAIRKDAFTMWSNLDPIFSIAEASRRPPDAPPSPIRDRRDEHLWNAALNAGAQYVVSHNTRDFPPAVAIAAAASDSAAPPIRHIVHGIEFLTAIEFIESVLGEDAATLYAQPLPPGIVRSHRSR